MKKAIAITLMILLAAWLGGCAKAAEYSPELKKALIDATVMAIDQELQSGREKLAAAQGGLGPRENVEKYKTAIAGLEKERDRFANMKPEDYPAAAPAASVEDPLAGLSGNATSGPIAPAKKKTIPVTPKRVYAMGAQLDLEGASRSGPFYQLADITGGCPCVLTPGRHFDLTVYLVFRREYFGAIENYYVYVADLGK